MSWSTGGIGRRGHTGAKSGRLFSDWLSEDYDPNDVVTADQRILGGRSADLARNNAYMVAMLNAFGSGVIGHEGMQFRSTYQLDDQTTVSEQEKTTRQQIHTALAKGTRGTSIDAAGLLTWRGKQDIALMSKAIYGTSVEVRVAKPNRPGRHSHATCWRTLHPMRLCNPDWMANDDRFQDGYELDDDGHLVAIRVLKSHPNKLTAGAFTWTRIPIYDAQGMPQVAINASRRFPEQVGGTGWAAPVMMLIKQLAGVQEAHVVAKRLQAALGMIVEVDDPKKAAAADRNGVVLAPNTKIVPGKVYYVRKGASVKPFDFKYNGQDYEVFEAGLLQAIAAAFGHGIPYQFAMQQLTKSNMASSRAALMQAWRSFRREGHELSQCTLQPMIESLLAEDLARGRIDVPAGVEIEQLAAGFWQPPPALSVDPARDMQAAKDKRLLGVSGTSVFRELGYEFDAEIAQTATDNQTADEQGVVLPELSPGAAPVEPEPPPPAEEPTARPQPQPQPAEAA